MRCKNGNREEKVRGRGGSVVWSMAGGKPISRVVSTSDRINKTVSLKPDLQTLLVGLSISSWKSTAVYYGALFFFALIIMVKLDLIWGAHWVVFPVVNFYDFIWIKCIAILLQHWATLNHKNPSLIAVWLRYYLTDRLGKWLWVKGNTIWAFLFRFKPPPALNRI